MVWNLGTLQPGEQKIVELKTNCAQITPKAMNVAVGTADPELRVQVESAIEINGLPAFRLEINDTADPLLVGDKTQYRIDVRNVGTVIGNQVGLTAKVPKELKVTNVNGPSLPQLDGNQITFPPVDSLRPGESVTYTVDAVALDPGDVRFQVEFTSLTLKEPIIEEENTTICEPTTKKTPSEPGRPIEALHRRPQ